MINHQSHTLKLQPIKNIYLSDDDADDRLLFESAFKEVCTQHTLTVFDDNTNLLANLEEPDTAIPDLFFMDLSMPTLNGLECLRIIRELPHLENVPVIIYSTIQSEMFVEEVHELGAAYYIRKPYDFYELVNLIKFVMELNWDDQADRTPFEDFVLSYNSIKKPLV